MQLPEDLRLSLDKYLAATKWHQRWPLVRITFFAIPLIVIILAAAAGMSVGAWIAMHCTNGTMPAGLQWLCF